MPSLTTWKILDLNLEQKFFRRHHSTTTFVDSSETRKYHHACVSLYARRLEYG